MANSTEREGVHYCGMIAEQNNWLFREQPIDDVGIDAHIEFIDESGKTRQLIALQIKSGESWFKEEKDGCFIFRDINDRQYNYWTSNPLPCIIILYNPKNKLCVWQKLTSKTIEKTNRGKGKGYLVRVPVGQLFFNNETNDEFLNISNLPENIINYNFLLSQKEFMQIINNGGSVKLHSTEWVNKSSGRGQTELIVNSGNEEKKYSYPYWFPFTPYDMVFPRLFPWATFSVDEDFYDEHDRNLWRDLHCYYDKEDNEWINVGDTFEEFRSKLKPIRGVLAACGEVSEYMLVLGLNDLGSSFLLVNEFVSKEQAYSLTRPESDLKGDLL